MTKIPPESTELSLAQPPSEVGRVILNAPPQSPSEVGRVIPNAPLELPNRKRLFHTTPPWVSAGEMFFLTICCEPRHRNQLARDRVFEVLRTSLEHNIKTGKLWVHLFLAMPDHLHALAAFPADQQMAQVIRNWKRYVAKNAAVQWQDGFFDHRLRDNENFELKADYIRMNPVRAGLAAHPDDWPYIWTSLTAR